MIKQRDRVLAIGLLLLAMALWGSAFVAMKKALNVAPIAAVMFFRLALASLAVCPFVMLRPQRWPAKGDVLVLGLLGILEPVLYFLFESLALQNTTASQGGLVFALLPLAIVAMTAIVKRSWPCARLWLAGSVAAAAVVVATMGVNATPGFAPAPALGNLLEGMAVLSAAAFTVTSDRLLTIYSPELVTLFQCAFGTFCFGTYWLFISDRPPLPTHALGYIFYLGLLVTGGAYYAFNNAIQKLSGAVVGPFYATVPVFALLSSIAWTGTGFSSALVLATAMSAAAIAIATARRVKS